MGDVETSDWETSGKLTLMGYYWDDLMGFNGILVGYSWDINGILLGLNEFVRHGDLRHGDLK